MNINKVMASMQSAVAEAQAQQVDGRGVYNPPNCGHNYMHLLRQNGSVQKADYYAHTLAPRLQDDVKKGKQMLADLNKAIDSCNDPAQKKELIGIKTQVQNELGRLEGAPPGVHGKWNDWQDSWNKSLSSAEGVFADAEMAMAMASSAGADSFTPVNCQVAPPRMYHVPSAGASNVGNTSGASASGDVSGTGGGIGNLEFGGKSVNDMIGMMEHDPKALMDHLGGMDKEDKQMAMQMMMQQLQEMNQMFSMMSNMMKSMHDTAKAAINNMRV